MIKTSFKQLVL